MTSNRGQAVAGTVADQHSESELAASSSLPGKVAADTLPNQFHPALRNAVIGWRKFKVDLNLINHVTCRLPTVFKAPTE